MNAIPPITQPKKIKIHLDGDALKKLSDLDICFTVGNPGTPEEKVYEHILLHLLSYYEQRKLKTIPPIVTPKTIAIQIDGKAQQTLEELDNCFKVANPNTPIEKVYEHIFLNLLEQFHLKAQKWIKKTRDKKKEVKDEIPVMNIEQ